MTLCSLEEKPEDGGSGFLHNIGMHLQNYMQCESWRKLSGCNLILRFWHAHVKWWPYLPFHDTSVQQNIDELCSHVSLGHTFNEQCVCVCVCVFNAICPTSFWCYRFLTIGPFRVFCLYPCLIRSLPLSDKPSVCKDGIAWLWHTWIKIILVDLFITSCILKLVHFGNCCCPWCMYT